jgi:hypothetical protein
VSDAGYSGTPQAKKLGIKPGLRVALDGAPHGWSLQSPPEGVEWVADGATADVIVAFVASAADLLARIDALGERIFPAGALWIAWPRKAAGHVSDVTDNVVREAALERGLVDVKVAAMDTDWSALKLVWRVTNR